MEGRDISESGVVIRHRWAVVGFAAVVLVSCGEDRPQPENRGSTYSLSGSVNIAEGVTINLRGAQSRTVVTGPKGRWTIRDLRPGSYVIAPSAQPGFVFQPVEIEVTIRNADVDSINFIRCRPEEGLSPAQAARLDTIPYPSARTDTTLAAVRVRDSMKPLKEQSRADSSGQSERARENPCS